MIGRVINIQKIIKENPGKDIHKIIAAKLFKVKEEKVTNEMRQFSKRYTFYELYSTTAMIT